MSARIVVTGGAGFVGSHAVVELLARGDEICVIDNFANSSPEVIARVAQLTGRDIRVEPVDMRDMAALERVLGDFRPDVVLHFAALKSVGEGEAIPLAYYDVNVGGTVSLLKAMGAAGCDRIVFSSSATVYGAPDYLPLDEAHPCRPESVYGRTKRMAEEILVDWAVATTGAGAMILRYFNPVGAHPSGDIGEDPRGTPNNLMPFLAQVAIGQRPEVAIFGADYETPDGTGIRDYIHVVDLAQAHTAAVDHVLRGPGSDIFNIGTGEGTSVRELVAAYGRACGRDLPFRVVGRREGDIPAYFADPSRAKAILGWRARLGIAEMCESSWKWQSRHPGGYGRRDPG